MKAVSVPACEVPPGAIAEYGGVLWRIVRVRATTYSNSANGAAFDAVELLARRWQSLHEIQEDGVDKALYYAVDIPRQLSLTIYKS